MNLYFFYTNARTAELFLNLSLQITVVSLLGWIAMKIWKPKSAPMRSAGHLAVLVSLAVLPVFTALSTVCRVAWFQSSIELSQLYAPQRTERFIPDSQTLMPVAVNDHYRQEMPAGSSNKTHNGYLKQDQILIAMNAFGSIWIVGFFVFIFRLTFKLSFLHGFLQNLSPGNNERLNRIYGAIKQVFKDRPMPEIYFSASLSSPVTIGIFRTKVILPQKIVAMCDDDIKSILLHELGHVFHRDNFIGLLQHVIASLFWWNPLIYFINSAYSDSREDVCDNYALNILKSPKRYANTLLDLAEKAYFISKMPATAGMILHKRSLEHRILGLLKRDRDLTTVNKPSFVALLLMVCMFIVSCGPGLKVSIQDEKGAMDNPELLKSGMERNRAYRFPLAPGGNWKLQQTADSSDTVYSLPYSSALICLSRRTSMEGKEAVHLSFLYRRWLYNIKGKYNWKNIRIISEGDAGINGHTAYYAILEYAADDTLRKDKVCFFRDNLSTYLLRYSDTRDSYEVNLPRFEEYVKSFEAVL